MTRRSHSTILWSLVMLLAIAGASLAQEEDVPTRLEVDNPEDVEDWEGEHETRTMDVQFCWEAVGANPENETMTIDVNVTAPGWLDITAPDTLSFEPPAQTFEGDCTEPTTVDVQFRATNGVAADEFAIEIQFSAREAAAGTFLAPSDETASFTVTAVPDETASQPPPAATDGEEADDDEERNWWPLIAGVLMIAAIVVIAAVLLTRRR